MLFSLSEKYVILQFKLCSILGASPVYWNDATRGFSVVQGSRQTVYKVAVTFHLVHVALLVAVAGSREERNMSTSLLKWNSTLLLVSSVFFHFGSWQKRADIVRLLSALAAFEEKRRQFSWRQRQMRPIEKIVMIMSPVSSVAFPISFGVTLWLKPCFPPFIGSLVLECSPRLSGESSSGASNSSALIRFFLCLLASWCWATSASMSMMVFSCILFLTTGCLNTYLTGLQRKEIRDYFACYREVQLLSDLLNSVQKKVLLPNLQVISTVTPIMSLYCCIKLHHLIPPPTLALCIMIMFDVVLCHYFVFGVAARAHLNSTRIVNLWGKGLGLEEEGQQLLLQSSSRKLRTSFARSCSPIKIRFGSLNFIGILTPLRFINFWILNTAKLAVVGRE